MKVTSNKKIIHIDMDAFYASIEQRDFPEYRGKPVAVGGSAHRGVVAAASYEARRFGVKSAMPSRTALKKCPDIIFVKPRFEVYRSVSDQIRQVFYEYTELVEPLSLDEAYLDVTHNKRGIPSATIIAREIRAEIKMKTGLTASAGVSVNKFVAKVASDMDKPDGLTVITPDKVQGFIEQLPIEKFFGIGKVTAAKMKKLGISNGYELKQIPRHELVRAFGKSGSHYYKIVRAEDNRPVKPDRIRKSFGKETTFMDDLTEADQMKEQLKNLLHRLVERMKEKEVKGKTITLKIKYNDFVINTRSKSIEEYTNTYNRIMDIINELLYEPHLPEKPVRLLGISLSNLNTEKNIKKDSYQLTLNF